MPGRSALTVTPWTASSEPMARRVGCHCAEWTIVVVTAAGGGSKKPASASFFIPRIWDTLIPPTMAKTMTTALNR